MCNCHVVVNDLVDRSVWDIIQSLCVDRVKISVWDIIQSLCVCWIVMSFFNMILLWLFVVRIFIVFCIVVFDGLYMYVCLFKVGFNVDECVCVLLVWEW